MNSQQIVLSKMFSRQRSLFYAYVWSESNNLDMENWLGANVQNILLYGEGETAKLSVWFEEAEIERIGDMIAELQYTDPSFIDGVVDGFYEYWEKLYPYVSGAKQIESIDELHVFYQNWVKWWSPMAILMVGGDQDKLPKSERDKALQVREDTQEYSDEDDNVFSAFIENVFPQYAGVQNFMTPEEIFTLKERDLNDNEVQVIHARQQNGYALLNHTLLSPHELDEELARQGLALDQVSDSEIDQLPGQTASPPPPTRRKPTVSRAPLLSVGHPADHISPSPPITSLSYLSSLSLSIPSPPTLYSPYSVSE